MIKRSITDICGGKRGGSMSTIETILVCIFVIGVSLFFIGAGIGILWMVIEDTSLGRAIDEIVEEKIERRKNDKVD